MAVAEFFQNLKGL